MSFTVSPGVAVREIDLTGVVSAAAAVEGGFAGKFRWGPVLDRQLVSSEAQLVNDFGTPTSWNATDFFTAASFLAYSQKLRVVRIGNELMRNASASGADVSVLNDDDYSIDAAELSSETVIAKYPGELGNSLAVAICTSADEFKVALKGVFEVTRGTKDVTFVPDLQMTLSSVLGTFEVGETVTGGTSGANGTITAVDTDYIQVGSVTGTFSAAETLTGGTSAATATLDSFTTDDLTTFFNAGDFLVISNVRYEVASVTATTITLVRLYGGATATDAVGSRLWQFAVLFNAAPGTNEAHVVIIDEDGEFTSEPGVLLESYEALSLVPGTKNPDGSIAYLPEAINRNSAFVRAGGVLESTDGVTPVDLSAVNTADKVALTSLTNGVDEDDALTTPDLLGLDEYIIGFDLFSNAETVDVPLLICPASDANAVLPNYLIQNIAEVRKDSVVFVSPRYTDVVNNARNEVEDTVAFRNLLPSSSYGFLDSNWKYMYDKYNDVFRWVPLSGDVAGLTARTELTREAWYSPAGFNRGGIKNVVKLAYNPDQAQRDDLYTAGVNPVADFPGQGTVLYGDKTLLAKPSAFDRINVRRLFIVLEKAIANAAQFTLFEFNDEFTRNQFVSLIEPFLRDVKARRGLYEFQVIADETVNTPQIIDENKFVGQIFLKPARSINFIRLDFVAVRTGVEFSEVIGSA